MIHLYLGLLLFSFFTTSILVVPFINILYRLKFQRQRQKLSIFKIAGRQFLISFTGKIRYSRWRRAINYPVSNDSLFLPFPDS